MITAAKADKYRAHFPPQQKSLGERIAEAIKAALVPSSNGATRGSTAASLVAQVNQNYGGLGFSVPLTQIDPDGSGTGTGTGE